MTQKNLFNILMHERQCVEREREREREKQMEDTSSFMWQIRAVLHQAHVSACINRWEFIGLVAFASLLKLDFCTWSLSLLWLKDDDQHDQVSWGSVKTSDLFHMACTISQETLLWQCVLMCLALGLVLIFYYAHILMFYLGNAIQSFINKN